MGTARNEYCKLHPDAISLWIGFYVKGICGMTRKSQRSHHYPACEETWLGATRHTITKIAHPSSLEDNPKRPRMHSLHTLQKNSPFPDKPNKAYFSQPEDVPPTYLSLPLHRDGFCSQQNRQYPRFLPTLYRHSPSIVRLYIIFTNRSLAQTNSFLVICALANSKYSF